MHRRSERGSVFLGVMVMLVPICALMGLVTDVGWWYFTAQSAHAAAEAAALAAVRSAMDEVSGETFFYTCSSLGCPAATDCSTVTAPNLQKGCAYATSNGFTSGGLGGRQTVKIQANTTSPVSGVAASYWVTVVISQQNPLTFLAVMGGSTMNVAVRATAAVVNTIPDACVTALNTTQSGIVTALGSPIVNLPNCNMKVDSSSPTALITGGAACVTAAAIQVVGGTSVTGCTGPAATTVPPFSDPLAGLAAPDVPSNCTHPLPTVANGVTTYYPGNYCAAINGAITFSPGVYNLMGGIDCHGGCTLTGTDVTFYNTCPSSPCNGTQAGGITLNGNSTSDLSAPASGPFAGILFFEDRTAAAQTYKINGTNNGSFNGTLYFPESTIDFTGNSTIANGNTMLVADIVSFSGNNTANFSVATGSNAIPSQPTAALIE